MNQHIVLYDDDCPLCQFQMKVAELAGLAKRARAAAAVRPAGAGDRAGS